MLIFCRFIFIFTKLFSIFDGLNNYQSSKRTNSTQLVTFDALWKIQLKIHRYTKYNFFL